MVTPLMPKATAMWLIQNTSLTFEQIADFCNLHLLEVQGMADGEVAKGIIGIDPIANHQLTKEEIIKCEADQNLRLRLSDVALKLMQQQKQKKHSKYTSIARRQDKPDAIAWLLKHCPEIKEAHIAKLVSATKNTVLAIKNKTHWNINNIKPKDPVLLGICTQTELNIAYSISKEKAAASLENKK